MTRSDTVNVIQYICDITAKKLHVLHKLTLTILEMTIAVYASGFVRSIDFYTNKAYILITFSLKVAISFLSLICTKCVCVCGGGFFQNESVSAQFL